MRRRLVGVLIAAAIAGLALAACGDGGAPKDTEPTGQYQLQTVGGEALPHFVIGYLNGEWDEISEGSLRVLSRGRLIVTATMDRRNPNGSLQRQTFDTVTFRYSRSGELVILSFQDFDGTRSDTLQLVDFGDNRGLHALSDNYRRISMPITMVNGALYVK